MLVSYESLSVFVEKNSAGKPVFEGLLVECCDPASRTLFRLLKSPGLVLGLASGDTFTIDPLKVPTVQSRSGNLAIQLFSTSDLTQYSQEILQVGSEIKGQVDAITNRLAVISTHFKNGFSEIKKAMTGLSTTIPGSNWYYGNVYDPIDGTTLLNWWLTWVPPTNET